MKQCIRCKNQIGDDIAICPICGQLQPVPQGHDKQKIKNNLIIAACVSVVAIPIVFGYVSRANQRKQKQQTSTQPATQSATQPAYVEAPEGKVAEDCYDIIETGRHSNGSYKTTVIEKVVGKEDVTVNKTMILKDADGNVIGKSESTINLQAGRNNYFAFNFYADITDSTQIETTAKLEPSIARGSNDAVELVAYNQSGNDLYITLRQTGPNIGVFSQYKLLFYKDGSIVGNEESYFDISADNLNGVGSEDVASEYLFNLDYDEIEYIYEP